MIGTSAMRVIFVLLALAVTACGVTPTGPSGQPSSTNVNPITGARGGTSAGSSR
jgi:hypothetical protein